MNIPQSIEGKMGRRCIRNMPFDPDGTDDPVAVGDLDSMEKGSGARKNEGKVQYDLVPLWIHAARWQKEVHSPQEYEMWEALVAWQEGDDDALEVWLTSKCPGAWIDEAVGVLEFGAKKYKAWNWACGMAWSVCTGCIIRHENKRMLDGQLLDDDSGLEHVGHTVCNIIFLAHFNKMYREGDDRPPVYKEEEA